MKNVLFLFLAASAGAAAGYLAGYIGSKKNTDKFPSVSPQEQEGFIEFIEKRGEEDGQ